MCSVDLLLLVYVRDILLFMSQERRIQKLHEYMISIYKMLVEFVMKDISCNLVAQR